jgi:hypothetical protein
MVIYDLECSFGHSFEGWFKDAEAYAKQKRDGQIHCSQCGVSHVQRLPSGLHIGSGGSRREKVPAVKSQAELPAVPASHSAPTTPAKKNVTLDPITMLKAIHHFVNENFRDAGRGFADEAIRMKRGEISHEPIHGRATSADQERMQDEGVACVLLPELPDQIKN